MTERPWQLQLLRRSLKKKEKLKLLDKVLTPTAETLILDLGCAQGILSFALRMKGGRWISTDLDALNLKTSQNLLHDNLLQTGPGALPFKDNSFDLIISLDYLEHLDDDDLCLREIRRVLKNKGELICAVPQTGRCFLIHKLRPLLGISLDDYGHKREGYTLGGIKQKIQTSGLHYIRHKNFSRSVTELIELLLNVLYMKIFKSKREKDLRDGHIRPSTPDEFASKKKAFRLYAFFYPLVWLITRLDKALFFLKGYALMVWAKKEESKEIT